MTSERDLARRGNFDDTWRSQDLNRLLRAITPIMQVTARKRDRLLRHHRDETVDDDDEMDLRAEMDLFLHSCSMLEVGFKAGVLADPNGRSIELLRPVLADEAVAAYYGPKRYPLVLPSEFLKRLDSKELTPDEPYEPAWFAKLVALNDRFRDPQLDDFLMLVDSFEIDDFDFSDLKAVAGSRKAIVTALVTRHDDREIEQRALVGLERFLFFSGDLAELMAGAPAGDLEDAAFNLYRYWFQSRRRSNLAGVVDDALAALSGGPVERLPERRELQSLFERA